MANFNEIFKLGDLTQIDPKQHSIFIEAFEAIKENKENLQEVYVALFEYIITSEEMKDFVENDSIRKLSLEIDAQESNKINFSSNDITVEERLLNTLLAETQELILRLPLQLNQDLGVLKNGGNVQLFVLESLKDLGKQRKGVNSTNTMDVNGFSRPFVQIHNTSITFQLPGAKDDESVFPVLDLDEPHKAQNFSVVKPKPVVKDGTEEIYNIDFKAYKINDTAYKNNFFSTLKSKIIVTNEGDFHARVDWMALYEVKKNDTTTITTTTTRLIWRTSGGGGHGTGRTDDVADKNYLWIYAGPNEYERLGELLGLKENRRVKTTISTGSEKKRKRDTTKVVSPKTPTSPIGGKFHQDTFEENIDHETIEYNNSTFVKVNTPYNTSQLNTAITSNTSLKILDIFQFHYYRKINVDNKVIKEKDNVRNRPGAVDLGVGINDPIPLHLPVSMGVNGNYANFRGFKKKRGVVKNKGRDLFKNKKAREDAGTVMGQLRTRFKDITVPGTGKLSATALAKTIMDKVDSKARKDWQTIKGVADTTTSLPTDQEWCHLRGHGDGGQERLGNFVSGSFHCNTEQLAIEIGQRVTTQAGTKAEYLLRSTAYLLKDDSLTDGIGHGEQLSKDNDLTKNNAPVASFIRYKIYKKDGSNGKGTKIFDYAFEGQSEFFDINQYNILNNTVRFMLAGEEEFNKWYNQKVEEEKQPPKKKQKK